MLKNLQLAEHDDARRHATPPVVGPGDLCRACDITDEANHRIANHLALLAGYVRLKAKDLAAQPEAVGRDSMLLLLKGVAAQIEAVARLHRALADKGRRESVDLSEHLHLICSPFSSGLAGAVTIIEDFPPGCDVRPDQVLPLAQIVSEVLTNAIKHAHPGGETGFILVRCGKPEPGGVLIEVIDDGAGLPEGFDPGTDGGLGFRLLRGLGKQLGAHIAFQSPGRGVCFQLTLPPATSRAAPATDH